jgi:hypothetical protein
MRRFVMRFPKFTLALGTLALAVASGASVYHVTIGDPTWVGGKELKPGEYVVQVEGDKAMIKNGKNVVEVPAKVETTAKKYTSTTLLTSSAGGKTNLEEIDVGGTTTKIVLR